ncbi:hypothetical protein T484DRAFT_1932815 [Baffinella frigidus]|nr:hypothetical protein T484DRAFT_1932815 [Cryptophyta sp. CCMP2293]
MSRLPRAAAALAGVALCCVAVTSLGPSSRVELVQRRRQQLYDSVSVGPYGGYDARTYYFPEEGTDGGMYQSVGKDYNAIQPIPDNNIYQNFQGPSPPQGSLVPWTWEDAMYQGQAEPTVESRGSLMPWTWEDAVYQGAAGPASNNFANTDWDDVIYQEPLPAE